MTFHDHFSVNAAYYAATRPRYQSRLLMTPAFEIRMAWNLDQFMAYVHKWSAMRRYIKREGRQRIDDAVPGLANVWGPVEQTREVVMPVAVIAGINES